MIATTWEERRKSPRWAINLAADIRFEGLDCTGFTADVSPFGAFVRANEDADPLLSVLQEGDILELRLSDTDGAPVELLAKVVHKHEIGLGLEFPRAEPRLANSADRPALALVG